MEEDSDAEEGYAAEAEQAAQSVAYSSKTKKQAHQV